MPDPHGPGRSTDRMATSECAQRRARRRCAHWPSVLHQLIAKPRGDRNAAPSGVALRLDRTLFGVPAALDVDHAAHLLRACRILNVPFEKQLRRFSQELVAAKKRRDDLIVRASDAGMSRRAVAAATGLSLTRVQQIVAARMEHKLASRADRNAASALRSSVARPRRSPATSPTPRGQQQLSHPLESDSRKPR
jgi:hypothetical protein